MPTSSERYVYLRSGQGFLDDSLYGRTQFHLEGGEYCHLMSFDRSRSYGFQMSTNTGHFVFHTPGGEGYSIVAFDRNRPIGKRSELWKEKLPLRVYGLVLAGENVFLGGVPDVVNAHDPLASFEGAWEAGWCRWRPAAGRNSPRSISTRLPSSTASWPPRASSILLNAAGDVHCFQGRPGKPGAGVKGTVPIFVAGRQKNGTVPFGTPSKGKSRRLP